MRIATTRLFARLIFSSLVLALGTTRLTSQTKYGKDFDTFVEDFQGNFAYIDRPDKPWLTWQQRFGPEAGAATSQEALDVVLASAIAELHDFHAEVRSPLPNRWLPVPTFADIWAEWRTGQAIIVAVRTGSDAERSGLVPGDRVTRIGSSTTAEAITTRLGFTAATADANARNWALLSILAGRASEARALTITNSSGIRTVTLPTERRFDRAATPLSTRTLPGNIGLIRFNNSLGEQTTVAAFDAVLNTLRTSSALILDLRDVPSGGDSSVALGIMGRLVTSQKPYQRHRIPHYGQPDIERNWVEFAAPRGPYTYNGPVAVLVDHWTGSMGEGIAIGLDGMGRGVVIGTPMAHLAGAVSDFHLPLTGTAVAFATE